MTHGPWVHRVAKALSSALVTLPFLMVVLGVGSAAAQHDGFAEHVVGEVSVQPTRVSLRQRVGVTRGEQLLISSKPADRLRGIELLAQEGSEEAVEALSEAMAPGNTIRTSPRSRLVAVRALAPHAAVEDVRMVLVSVVNSVRAGASESPLETLARKTAAMALAKDGSEAAITALLTAVIGGGPTGDMASSALVAHPPAKLGPLSQSRKDMPAAQLRLLGELGDPRVIGVVRKQLKRKAPEVKRAAALALAQLGDGVAAVHARAWLSEEPSDDDGGAAQVVAAKILMLLDAPGAAAATAKLIGAARSRAEGLRLAGRSLSPALLGTLAAVIDADVTHPERVLATVLVSKIGGDQGARILLPLLADPKLATFAAFGLARLRSDVAHHGLDRALAGTSDAAARRLILRAGVVRYLVHRAEMAGLEVALERALASDDAADRTVGAFGLVAIGARDAGALLRHGSDDVAGAAARGALALGSEALSQLAPLFERAVSDGAAARTTALGVSLLYPGEAIRDVPTVRLARWAEAGGALAPLAAMRLAARGSELFRERVERLLAGTDPIVRLHVALGLAQSPDKTAVALVGGRYRFEIDVRVRRAIIRALSLRRERRRLAVLERARDFDPDPGVRALARSALAGRTVPIAPPLRGRDVAWISLRPNSDSERRSVSARAAVLLRADGVALPLLSAPDGVVVVPGLAGTGTVSLRLAPGAPTVKP